MPKRRLIVFLILFGAIGFVVYRAFFYHRATNFILISIDTLRPDHLGCYGYPLDQPNLSKFARESLVFDRAYTTMPTTGPAMASVLTSLYPRTHTVRKNGIELPDAALTLAEIFKQNHWKTAAFISAFPLDKRFKFNQGFDDYKDSIGAKGKKKNLKFEVPADQITTAVSRWLQKTKPKDKTFIWIHFFDPHQPYNPPKDFQNIKSPLPNRTEDLDHYDGEIAFLDQQLGVLFQKLKDHKLWDHSLIAVISDHGEGFGEHGYYGHGWFLYEEVARVVWMFHGPGIHKGRTDALTQHIDFAPGVLDYFKIPLPKQFQGRSWWNVQRGRLQPHDEIWIERRLPPIATGAAEPDEDGHESVEEKWALRSASGKLIWSSDKKDEFYQIANDPKERTNQFSTENKAAMDLMKKGLAIRARAASVALKGARDIQSMDEETREALKALGYVN